MQLPLFVRFAEPNYRQTERNSVRAIVFFFSVLLRARASSASFAVMYAAAAIVVTRARTVRNGPERFISAAARQTDFSGNVRANRPRRTVGHSGDG